MITLVVLIVLILVLFQWPVVPQPAGYALQVLLTLLIILVLLELIFNVGLIPSTIHLR